MRRFPALAIAAFAGSLLLAGCATHKPDEAPPPAAGPGGEPAPGPVTGSNIAPGSAEDFRVNVGDTVHFGFNEYNISDEDRGVLQRQATWLNRYPSVRVSVEGDCDERGTREYNLALGARRANAVKEYLVSLGVSSARVETVSYGKEHPICSESSEECWAQNRRGVTNITSGAGGASS